MSFRFTFGTVGSTTELNHTMDFILKQELKYPGYDKWANKTRKQIDSGEKTAIIALSEGKIVADIIYQQHKVLPRVRELKNLRVHKELGGRGFARFILRQAESDRPDYDLIMGDARQGESEVISLMLTSGYTQIANANLYDRENNDIVFAKTFNRRTDSGLVYQAKDLILSQNLQ